MLHEGDEIELSTAGGNRLIEAPEASRKSSK
jgi:hypothetical protein